MENPKQTIVMCPGDMQRGRTVMGHWLGGGHHGALTGWAINAK